MALLGRLFSSSSSPSLSSRGSKRSLGGNDIEDLRLCPNISSDADSLASEMNAHAARLLSAAISLEYCASRISYRYSITHRMFLLAFADIRDALVAAQSIFRWSCLQLLSARSKSLDDQSDETDVNAKVLAMYSRVCDGLSVVDSMGSASSVSAISSFLASLDARMLARESAIFATACINMDVTAAALHHCFWMQEGHDPTATVVSGSGALWCRAGDDTHNRIRVEVKDEIGDAIVGLDTSDFVVEVRVGDVPPVPPSLETMIGTAFEFVYNVEKSGPCGSKTATIDVLLFGQLIVSKSVSIGGSIDGDAVAVLTTRFPLNNCSLAVSPCGRWLAVSHLSTHSLTLYSTLNGEEVKSFGGLGVEPGKFNRPLTVAFANNGSILVAENGNRRLQQVSCAGSHLRFIGADVFDGCPRGLAVNDALIAVSQEGVPVGLILLFSWPTGDLIRCFGEQGPAVHQLDCCINLRISPDGDFLYIANHWNHCVSVFTLQGEFVRALGVGSLRSPRDLCFSLNGDLLVADADKCCVCCLPAHTDHRMERVIGREGTGLGQFQVPTSLALHKHLLFVLDSSSPRVQVFQ